MVAPPGALPGAAPRAPPACAPQPAVARPPGQDPFAPGGLVSVASCPTLSVTSTCSYAGCAGCPHGPGPPADAGTSYDGCARSWWHSASLGTFCPNCPI